jgi:hypothetical protein
MLSLMARGTDKQVLDIVVGSSETEVGVGRQERNVRCLRQLSNLSSSSGSSGIEHRKFVRGARVGNAIRIVGLARAYISAVTLASSVDDYSFEEEGVVIIVVFDKGESSANAASRMVTLD